MLPVHKQQHRYFYVAFKKYETKFMWNFETELYSIVYFKLVPL